MEFEDIIKGWIEEVNTQVDGILQTVVYQVGKELVTLSPVDTGRFKGNWQITINARTNHSLVRYDEAGTQTLGDMARDVKVFTAGQVAYIQNMLTYGVDLEGGSSKQAPDGIIAVTVPRFNLIVQQAIRMNSSS